MQHSPCRMHGGGTGSGLCARQTARDCVSFCGKLPRKDIAIIGYRCEAIVSRYAKVANVAGQSPEEGHLLSLTVDGSD